MGRHEGSGGRHHAPGVKGKGHKGRRVMVTRRQASGMDKASFEAMVKHLGIQARQS